MKEPLSFCLLFNVTRGSATAVTTDSNKMDASLALNIYVVVAEETIP